MTARTIKTDVLIIGAGPTGLTLGNVLGNAGVSFLVVDRKPSTIDEPRAVSIDDESLRTMQSFHLADEVLQDVVPGYGVHYFTRKGGRCFGRVEPTVSEYGYPRRNAFRQPLFEATLRHGLDRYPTGRALFNHNLESFEQDSTGIQAQIKDQNGESLTVHAKFMVGSDGGRSTVRELLGIEMIGSTFRSRWLVIDTENDDDTFSQMRVYCDASRPVVDVPGPHRTRRFEIYVHPGESAEETLDPARIRQLLMPFRGDRDTDIIRKTVYTFHARVAERWQERRVFLAGDAAHLTPPYAGQGMNSGVRDACNLGWKLAGVLGGRFKASVLDSYEPERREHAWALIRLALNLGVVMAPSSRLSALAAQSFFFVAAYIRPVRNYFLQMKFKPKPRFSKGLLGPADGLDRRSLRGRMFPQPLVQCRDNRVLLLDELVGNRFALLEYGPGPTSNLGRLLDPLWKSLDVVRIRILPSTEAATSISPDTSDHVTVIDTDDALILALEAHHARIVVMRPDRYVAGSFALETERAFAAVFASCLGVGSTTKPASVVTVDQEWTETMPARQG